MNAQNHTALAICFVLGAILTGCATTHLPQTDDTTPIPAAQSVKEYTLVGPDASRPSMVRVIELEVGPDMAQQCGLTRTHFEFDSAEPLPQDRLALKDIAACLNRPEIEKLSVELVGRADAKGRSDYNMNLGQRRADRVKEILVAEGVAVARLTTTSRGSSDAKAKGEGLYAEGFDRRVDINLVGIAHAPR